MHGDGRSDAEIVTAWLGAGAGRGAARLIVERGGLHALMDVTGAEAKALAGRAGAARLLAAIEVLRRVRGPPPSPGDRLSGAADVAAIYAPRLEGELRER